MISDHAQTNTGVAVQSNHLIKGLLQTNKYEITQLGAAVYHDDYSVVNVEEDFNIIPINGFGDKDIIRSMLVSYDPDVLVIFSDSRFFEHIFEMEDEIHQVCPIMWWHVWDNRPAPLFNKPYYDSVDTINCISELTYNLCNEVITEKNKINYIPHSVPEEIFYTLSQDQVEFHKLNILGDRKDDFICTWINRNTKRKRPGDLLKSWQMFLMDLEHKYKHKKAIVLHNISDVCINISSAEGFGLSTLEAMYVGKPIIATQTGGLIRQLINPEDSSINGVSLKPNVTTISGTQKIPYLNEDYASLSSISKGIMEIYETGKEKRKEIGLKAQKYAKSNFSYISMIKKWDDSIDETLLNWKSRYKRISIEEIE